MGSMTERPIRASGLCSYSGSSPKSRGGGRGVVTGEIEPIDRVQLAFGVRASSVFDALAIFLAEIVKEALMVKRSEDRSNRRANFGWRRVA
jgi:hypothetical protein